jgi:hypothetical protein
LKNKTKAWILFALVLIIIGQLTFLNFFHSTQLLEGYASGTSFLVISKQEYAFARLDITLSPGQVPPVTLLFQNGTKVNVTSNGYSFVLVFPRTGDYMGNAEVGGQDINVSQTQPIDVAIDANETNTILLNNPNNGFYSAYPGIDVYWIEIIGYAEVSVQGYGIAY